MEDKFVTWMDKFGYWYAVTKAYDLKPDCDPKSIGHGYSEEAALKHLKELLIQKEK